MTPLLAVLDTNVLVSALILPTRLPARLLRHALAREFVLILSEAILTELAQVLARPKMAHHYGMTPERAQEFIGLLREVSRIVPGNVSVQAVPGDAKDDHVVACAVEGEAGVIVSGDEHLKSMGQYQSIPVLSPAQFLGLLQEALGETKGQESLL